MEIEQLFYKLGKIVFVLGCIFAIAMWITDYQIISWIPDCKFLSITGLYCPGCGGTRAVKSLLRGDVIKSFLYHPFVIYCVVAYIVFMIYEFIKKHFYKFQRIFPVEVVIYIGIGVLLFQWIVKVALQFIL